MAFCLLFAGLETLFIFVIRGPYSRGVSWPVTLMGVLATVFILSGYVPIPFEIVKRRGRVVGIDLGFLTIDCLGALFSAMALGTDTWPFDVTEMETDVDLSGPKYLRHPWWFTVHSLVRAKNPTNLSTDLLLLIVNALVRQWNLVFLHRRVSGFIEPAISENA